MTVATLFSDMLFKPPEFWGNDMTMWRHYQDLLAFMISNHD